jgi:hypothetical protein
MRPEYIPRGKMWLPDALDRLIRIRRGLSADSVVPSAPFARIKETKELREALAENDLVARIKCENGREYPIESNYWHRPVGRESLENGRASWTVAGRYPTSDRYVSGHVILNIEDFENWAEPAPTGRAKPDEHARKTWMRNAAREVQRQTEEKPFKEDLVSRCMAANGCSEREATAAFKDGVPDELKRGPTEKRPRTSPQDS